MENVKALIKAIKTAEAKNATLTTEKNSKQEAIYSIIDTVKKQYSESRLKARQEQKSNIEELHIEMDKIQKSIDFNNLYIKALAQEALKEYEVIICNKLLANKSNIENVPARYKKVKNLLDCSEGTECRAWYSEYYHYIEVTFAGNVLPYEKRSLYITKNFNDPVLDFEQIERSVNHENKTADQIKKAVEKFIKAQEKITAINAEAAAKVSKIKADNYILGLSFK